MENNKKEAVAYIVYDETCFTNWTFKHQKKVIEEYADTNGIIINHFFIDELKFQRREYRKGYQGLINCIKNGGTNMVLICSLGRLNCNICDFGHDLKIFKKYGVHLASVADGVDIDYTSN